MAQRRVRYIPPQTTKSGQESNYQTVRIYDLKANAESVYLYISTYDRLLNARRLWLTGYGTPTGQSEGTQAEYTPEGKAHLTIMPARSGDFYKYDPNLELEDQPALKELREWIPKLFSEVDHIDIKWRVE